MSICLKRKKKQNIKVPSIMDSPSKRTTQHERKTFFHEVQKTKSPRPKRTTQHQRKIFFSRNPKKEPLKKT